MMDARRQELVQALPYGRRFGRALAGSQKEGDVLVKMSLENLLVEEGGGLPIRHNLYRRVAQHCAARVANTTGGLSFTQRALLLLTALEGLSLPSATRILGMKEGDALEELAKAHDGLRRTASTSVLIIEDEPIIAMDIQDVVEECGHAVAAVAHTEADAVRLASTLRPGLILADINLGAGGDGMQAVRRIMKTHDIPVVFVTAYPERLLTSETEEPSFVITKPFEPLTLAITTYQAVTGGLTAF
ncbi:PhyR family response regulator anti-anti-sigma factor [Acidomonas methanolica]|uniref:PhyR family response regulator anti-anti-sigma factor n=1 Tax=Acidomonas methanolica TaxID=437 RepID=UPI00211AA4DF|nr:response regulator [Acidomonas methanolica]MCQ9155080.1 response regulator [Acidomonas methanolica]